MKPNALGRADLLATRLEACGWVTSIDVATLELIVRHPRGGEIARVDLRTFEITRVERELYRAGIQAVVDNAKAWESKA